MTKKRYAASSTVIGSQLWITGGCMNEDGKFNDACLQVNLNLAHSEIVGSRKNLTITIDNIIVVITLISNICNNLTIYQHKGHRIHFNRWNSISWTSLTPEDKSTHNFIHQQNTFHSHRWW